MPMTDRFRTCVRVFAVRLFIRGAVKFLVLLAFVSSGTLWAKRF
jgi:hypothetical protein